MKRIGVYFAVLLVLAVFGMTILAHASDLTADTDVTVPVVSTDYEVPITFEPITEPPTAAAPLRLDRTSLSMIYKQTEKLAVTPANAKVTWSSTNDTVAKVDDKNGTVTAVGRGTAVITATRADGAKAECAVKVRYTLWQWLIRIFLFGWIWY